MSRFRLRNLTPHPVTLVGPDGEQHTIAPDPAGPARVVIGRVEEGTVDIEGVPFPVPVFRSRVTAPAQLPEPEPGVLLLVARAVAETVPDRQDLVIVDQTVRDDQGRIIGAQALARL
ncbi:hypothetical protein [Thermaerobacter litoralis]